MRVSNQTLDDVLTGRRTPSPQGVKRLALDLLDARREADDLRAQLPQRVTIDDRSGPTRGLVYGWLHDEHGTLCAVVKRDCERLLDLVHFSRVNIEPPAWALEVL